MYDLAILHLSDLHITSSENSDKLAKTSHLFKALYQDVEAQIKDLEDKSIIIAITGDMIDQGTTYKEDPSITERAYTFFENLKTVLGEKVSGIFFVPGNHDRARTDYEKLFLPAYRSMFAVHQIMPNKDEQITEKFNKKFYKIQWKNHLNSYKKEEGTGYIELTKRVYELFGMNAEEDFYGKNTYGVAIKEILGKSYCFVLLNTAWSCFDNNDKRNVILGKFQLDDIVQQRLDLCGNNTPVLTIVLGHHPLNMLCGLEHDNLLEKMVSTEFLATNVYLCGHTHDGAVTNWNSYYHSFNTFMTGFGQSDGTLHEHYANYRYSLYVFHLDLNSIDVYVRKWNDTKFDSDMSFYKDSSNSEKNKIIFPIHAEQCKGYLPLSVAGDDSDKGVYISDTLIAQIQHYVEAIVKWRTDLVSLAADNKTDVYSQIEESIPGILKKDFHLAFFQNALSKNKSVHKKIKSLLSQNQNAVFPTFLGFMQEICKKLWDNLLKNRIQSNDVVRVHFRFLDMDSNIYKKLCCYSIEEQHTDLSTLKYGELLEQSYKSKRGLIYSVNRRFTKRNLKERWENFITIVPVFKENVHCNKYPYLTFGVTISDVAYNDILYCMDYFSMNNLLGDILADYVKQFQINLEAFCQWAAKEIESTVDTEV